MKSFGFRMILLTWLLLPDACPLYAEERKPYPVAEDMPVYNSPATHSDIRRRVAGEESGESGRGWSRSWSRGLTRGEGGDTELPSHMSPLAPESLGLASKDQPVVAWYVSGPWTGKMEFVVTDTQARRDVLKTHIKGPENQGVHLLSLAEHGITLSPGITYEWFLAIVPDETERSADFVASALIRYAEPSGEVSERLAGAPEERRCEAYAQEGYWYDAIEHVSRLIEAKPGDKGLRCRRAALLRQVNLPIAAAHDCARHR